MNFRPLPPRTFLALSLLTVLGGTAAGMLLAGTSPAAVLAQPQRWHLALLASALAAGAVTGLAVVVVRAHGRRTEKTDAIIHGFVEASTEAMAIMDTNGRILCGNRRLEALLGYTREELVARPIEEFLHQDRRAQGFASIQIDFFDTSSRVPYADPGLVAPCTGRDGRAGAGAPHLPAGRGGPVPSTRDMAAAPGCWPCWTSPGSRMWARFRSRSRAAVGPLQSPGGRTW